MIKRNIPNLLTCGNLLCGCLAIVNCFEGNLVWAAYLVGIAAILDFFDGFVARLLKVSSPIGKDLDSLADMVTFGVVPGVMMFKLISISKSPFIIDGSATKGWTIYPPLSAQPDVLPELSSLYPDFIVYIAFIITIFSAIRLAKFNNDTRQSESFIGLNTPSNAMIICSMPLILKFHPDLHFAAELIHNTLFLCILSLVLSFLLVSEIPFFALKFKHFKWKGNEVRFTFLIWSVLLLALLQFVGIPLVILSYLLFSVGNNLINRSKKPLS